MKTLRPFLLFIVFVSNVSFGQVVNINPDPNGDPWIVGDAITSPDNTSPLMQLSTKSANTILPSTVDNASRKYMPPVFNQRASGSCVHELM